MSLSKSSLLRAAAVVSITFLSLSPSLASAQISLGGISIGGGGVGIGGPSGIGVGIGGGGIGAGIGGPGGIGVGIGGGGLGVGIGGIGGIGGLGGGIGVGVGPGGIGINPGGIGGVGGLQVNSSGAAFGGANIVGRGPDGRLVIRAGTHVRERANLGLNLGPTLQVIRSAKHGDLLPGFRLGDVLTAIDGRRIASKADLIEALATRSPNEDVLVTLSRAGTTQDVLVRLGNTLASATSPEVLRLDNLVNPTLDLSPADTALRALAGISILDGLKIDGVDPTGAAAGAGLQAGDIILSAGGAGVASKEALAEVLAGLQLCRPIDFTVLRGGNPTGVVMQPGPGSVPNAIVGAAGVGGGTGLHNALVGDVAATPGAGLGTVIGQFPNSNEHAAALGTGGGLGATALNTIAGDGGVGTGLGAGALLGGFPGRASNDNSAVGAGGGLGTALANTPVGNATAGTGLGAGLLQADLDTLGSPNYITALGSGGGLGAGLDNKFLGNTTTGLGAGVGALIGNIPTATQPGGGLALGTGTGGGLLNQNSPVGNLGVGGGAGLGAIVAGLGTPGGPSGNITGLGTGGGLGVVLNNTPVGDIDAGTGVGVGALLGGKNFNGSNLTPDVGLGEGVGVGINNSPLGNINARTGAGAGLLLGGFTSGNILQGGSLNGTTLDAGGGILLTGANTPTRNFSVEPTPGVQLAVGNGGSNPAGVVAGERLFALHQFDRSTVGIDLVRYERGAERFGQLFIGEELHLDLFRLGEFDAGPWDQLFAQDLGASGPKRNERKQSRECQFPKTAHESFLALSRHLNRDLSAKRREAESP